MPQPGGQLVAADLVLDLVEVDDLTVGAHATPAGDLVEHRRKTLVSPSPV